MPSITNYHQNKLIDARWRAQVYGPPATNYFALFTAAPGVAGGGTEAAYTGYARVAVTSALASFAGTQSAGSTVASSGTSGQTSNNAAITFGAPTSGPSTQVSVGIYDASSAGNLWDFNALTTSRTLNNGDSAPAFAIAAFTYTVS